MDALIHRHSTLNGAHLDAVDEELFADDATYEKMVERGLTRIYRLGYDHIALHSNYREANPSLGGLGWLELVATSGDWNIYKVRPALAPA